MYDILVFSINTGFIFIEWYENKYFTSDDSHEWNIKNYTTQKKAVFIEKKLEFSVYYLNDSVVIKNWWLTFIDLNLRRK